MPLLAFNRAGRGDHRKPQRQSVTSTAASTPWRSPIADIERAVQDRATTAAIDMNAAGSLDQLRGLVADEVAHWHQEFQRGRRTVDIADPDRAIERALRNLTGYGPLEALL